MRRFRQTAGLLLVSMLLTAGCAKKIEKIPESTQNVTGETGKASADTIEQFRSEEKWEEEFSVTHEGEEMPVAIDAKIVLPDRKNLSVVEGHVLDFEEAFQTKTARYLFHDADIFLADDAHMTKEDLQKRMESLEKTLKFYDHANEPAWENQYNKIKETLSACQEYLKTAKDSYTVIADDFTADHYVADKNNIWYRLDFEKLGEGDSYYAMIRFEAKELKDVAPKSIIRCDYVALEETANLRVENSCRYSLDEARKMVEDLLDAMGLLDMTVTKEYSLKWSGWNINGDTKDSDSNISTGVGSEVNGYKFAVSLVNDGEVLGGELTGVFSGEIAISDEGIVSAAFTHPFAIEKTYDSVKLLSLGQIEEGFRQELKNNAESHIPAGEEERKLKYTELKLVYLPVVDEKEPEKISFLPCWRLQYKSWNQWGDTIYINAVDGSVIPPGSIYL